MSWDMRFKELIFKNKTYNSQSDIIRILRSEDFLWLIDSEVKDAIIEIKNNTLIWHSGDYIYGDWHYGIFKGGRFFGNWESGIFEDGIFGGILKDGIELLKK